MIKFWWSLLATKDDNADVLILLRQQLAKRWTNVSENDGNGDDSDNVAVVQVVQWTVHTVRWLSGVQLKCQFPRMHKENKKADDKSCKVGRRHLKWRKW